MLVKDKTCYIYEHCRQDTGAVFYVGKGSGSRANRVKGRNNYWRNVVAKAGGFSTRLIVTDVDEELAFLAEVERIDQYKRIGVRLCNLTTGGEGASGRFISDSFRKRMSETTRDRMAKPEFKAASSSFMKSWWDKNGVKERMKEKMRQAFNSPDVHKKLSDAGKARMAIPVIREKVRQAAKAQWSNQSARENLRQKGLTRLADPNAREHLRKLAKQRMSDPAERQRIRDALMAAERVVCPHCDKQGAKSPMSRWHFDNCKHKGEA